MYTRNAKQQLFFITLCVCVVSGFISLYFSLHFYLIAAFRFCFAKMGGCYIHIILPRSSNHFLVCASPRIRPFDSLINVAFVSPDPPRHSISGRGLLSHLQVVLHSFRVYLEPSSSFSYTFLSLPPLQPWGRRTCGA